MLEIPELKKEIEKALNNTPYDESFHNGYPSVFNCPKCEGKDTVKMPYVLGNSTKCYFCVKCGWKNWDW